MSVYTKATEKGWPVFEMEGRVLMPWLSKYSPFNGQYNGTCCFEVVEHNSELKCVVVTFTAEMTDEMADEVPPTKGNAMIKKWMKNEERGIFVNEYREEVVLRVESGTKCLVVDGAKTQALTKYKRASKKGRHMGKEQIRAEKELMDELKAMMTADEREAMRAEVEQEYKTSRRNEIGDDLRADIRDEFEKKYQEEFVYAVNVRMDASRVYGVLSASKISPDVITSVDGTMRLMFKTGDASALSANVRSAFATKK